MTFISNKVLYLVLSQLICFNLKINSCHDYSYIISTQNLEKKEVTEMLCGILFCLVSFGRYIYINKKFQYAVRRHKEIIDPYQ